MDKKYWLTRDDTGMCELWSREPRKSIGTWIGIKAYTDGLIGEVSGIELLRPDLVANENIIPLVLRDGILEKVK